MSGRDDTPLEMPAAGDRQRRRKTSDQILEVVRVGSSAPPPRKTIDEIVAEAVAAALEERDEEWQRRLGDVKAQRRELLEQRDALWSELEELKREIGR